MASVVPNAAHRALARLEGAIGDELLVVTQNVDDLHERAGSRNLVHMHGELRKALCAACAARVPWDGELVDGPPCPACGARALRPDVVWFGEMPYELERIEQAVVACDVFVAIGTSGEVYPAAGYVALAAAFGAHTVELNLAAGRRGRAVRRGACRAGDRDRARLGRRGDRVPVMTEPGHAECALDWLDDPFRHPPLDSRPHDRPLAARRRDGVRRALAPVLGPPRIPGAGAGLDRAR